MENMIDLTNEKEVINNLPKKRKLKEIEKTKSDENSILEPIFDDILTPIEGISIKKNKNSTKKIDKNKKSLNKNDKIKKNTKIIPWKSKIYIENYLKIMDPKLNFEMEEDFFYISFSQNHLNVKDIGIDIGWKHLGIVGLSNKKDISFLAMISNPKDEKLFDNAKFIANKFENVKFFNNIFPIAENILLENQLGNSNPKSQQIFIGIYFYLLAKCPKSNIIIVPASFKTYQVLENCFIDEERILIKENFEKEKKKFLKINKEGYFDQNDNLTGLENKNKRKKKSVFDFFLINQYLYKSNFLFVLFMYIMKKNKKIKEKLEFINIFNPFKNDLTIQELKSFGTLDKLNDITDSYFTALYIYIINKLLILKYNKNKKK